MMNIRATFLGILFGGFSLFCMTNTAFAVCQNVADQYKEQVAKAKSHQNDAEKALTESNSDGKSPEEKQKLKKRSRESYKKAARGYTQAYNTCKALSSIRYGIGLMYERARSCDDAKKWYEDIIADKNNRKKLKLDARLKASIKKAEENLALLSDTCVPPKEAPIVVNVSCAGEDTTLTLGEEEASCPHTFTVPPGEYTLEASAPEGRPFTRTLSIKPGSPELNINVPDLNKKIKVEDPKPVEPITNVALLWGGIGAAGVGTAMLVGGFAQQNWVLGEVQKCEVNDPKTDPVNPDCTIKASDAKSGSETAQLLIGVGGSLVAVGAVGIISYFVLGSLSEENSSEPQVMLGVTPQGASMSVLFSF